MFSGFSRLWVILALARDIRGDRLRSYTVAGERIVVFRDADGRVAALLDRCPHRGAALSLGRVCAGVVECPFHGWRFAADGRNCHVPWNPDARRERLGATPLAVREAAGLVWLYTGAAAEAEADADNQPMPGEALLRDDVRLCAQSVAWDIHWTRVMENMLDSPHLPFVHRASIGRSLVGWSDRRMDLRWQATRYGADILSQIDGAPRDGARLSYRFPNAMELRIDPPGRILRLLAVCTPQSPDRTTLSLYTVRNFARLPAFDALFRRMNARIAREDRAIVESSQPAEVPHPAAEKSVRTDAPTLAFRKIYLQRIRGGDDA